MTTTTQAALRPEPANPAAGGSYTRDPVTGNLQPLHRPGEAAPRLHRAAQADGAQPDTAADTPAQEA